MRKRLKGYGFGVRDVQAPDRNAALTLHTATGDHLRELQAFFSDVASSTSRDELQIEMYLLLVAGRSIRQFSPPPSVSLPLSKNAAAWFMQSPVDPVPIAAMRWALIDHSVAIQILQGNW